MTDATMVFQSDGATQATGAASYTGDTVVAVLEGADIIHGFARAIITDLKTSASTATVRGLLQGSNDGGTTWYDLAYSDDVVAVTTTGQGVQISVPILSRYRKFRLKIVETGGLTTVRFYWKAFWTQTRYA